MKKPIVIIGTGLAGYATAREFRKVDEKSKLVLLTSDDGGSYSKPMLSTALAQKKSVHHLVNADVDQMQTSLGATIFSRSTVHQIDIKKKILSYSDRNDKLNKIKYHKLVLAVGANPVRAVYPGNASEQIFSINNLNDYSNFRKHLFDSAQVAIIGGGIIGCEFANDLINSGYKVHVISRSLDPMSNLLPTKIANQLLENMQKAGIAWYGGSDVQSIEKQDTGFHIMVKSNTGSVVQKLQADIIISAIGLRPNIQLAQAGGLTVKTGICVDRYLRSSDPHIFALGDCAEVEGYVLPYVMPLMQASKALGRNLVDDVTSVKYPVMPVIVKTPLYPIVVCPPQNSVPGEWYEEEEVNGMRGVYRDEQGQICGFALSGDQITRRGEYVKQMNDLIASG